MTEQEWQSSIDPVAMLDWVMQHRSPSDRKLRLVACAIVRSVWEQISEEYPRRCASWAEMLADNGPTKTRCADAESKYSYNLGGTGILLKNSIGLATCVTPARNALDAVCREHTLMDHVGDQSIARAIQSNILRDIVGNPFQHVTLPPGDRNAACPVCVGFKGHIRIADRQASPPPSPACAMSREDYQLGSLDTWRKETATRWATCPDCKGIGTGHGPSPVLTPIVLQLAEAAYTVRTGTGALDNDALAVLSDALEEAGLEGASRLCRLCNGSGIREYMATYNRGSPCVGCYGAGMVHEQHPILAHLRSTGPHYRGCWALDLILGKE